MSLRNLRMLYNPLKTPSRLPSIEILRGLAASAVCFFHFICGNKDFFPDHSLIDRIGSFGFLGVEVFFVISGFIIPYALKRINYTIKQYPRFILRRLLRLEPPYLASIVLVVGLNILASRMPGFQGGEVIPPLGQVLPHFLYLIPLSDYTWLSPVYWTLAVEFQYYLLMGVLFLVLNRSKNLGFVALSLLLLASAFLITQGISFFRYTPFFVLGFTAYKFFVREIHWVVYALLTAAALTSTVHLFGFSFAVAGALPVLVIQWWPSWQSPVLEFLGKISYSLYLIHVPVGGKIINLSARFVDDLWMRMVVVCLAFGICVGVAYIFYKLLELPALHWSQKIILKPITH